MERVEQLIAGFRVFRTTYFEQRPALFKELSGSQHPATLLVSCCDSRVDPAILLNAQPGELFVVRNVANLVPPYAPDGKHHSTSAALEFGVRDLGVKNVVVMGHSKCGGVQALSQAVKGGLTGREFIAPWVSIIDAEAYEGSDITQLEHAAVRTSLRNMRSFPWIREKAEAGALSLHGWWFNMEEGQLWGLNESTGQFELLAG